MAGLIFPPQCALLSHVCTLVTFTFLAWELLQAGLVWKEGQHGIMGEVGEGCHYGIKVTFVSPPALFPFPILCHV